MKRFIVCLVLLIGCGDYVDYSPPKDLVEKYGQCGELCHTHPSGTSFCLEFFPEGTPCNVVGYYGECYEQRCWIDFDATCTGD